MSSTATATVVKMMESLPETAQDQVAEHLREFIEDLQDELLWDESFRRTTPRLIDAAKQAKREIAAGHAAELDPKRL